METILIIDDEKMITRMLKGFLEGWRKECDLLVVLSHAGMDEDRKLAGEFPGIDVIVGAHSQTFMGEPARVGKRIDGVLVVEIERLVEEGLRKRLGEMAHDSQ